MSAPPSTVALLLLADGRLPAGGHAHSGGLEAAVATGRVVDVETLAAFLAGRLATAGLVAAAFAAAACALARASDASEGEWRALDAEADARTASPALRDASRRQGRQLLRAGAAIWPTPARTGDTSRRPEGARCPQNAAPEGPHHAVALGMVAAAAGLSPAEAALAAAHGSVTGPASAGVRLLSLDPLAVHAVIGRLAPEVDEVTAAATAAAMGSLSELPCPAAPLLDIGAEWHAAQEVRLFAS